MTSAEPLDVVVVDTNVLLAATDSSRATHAAALDFLDTDPRRLAVTPQILREYVAVATRPAENNGLGQASADAAANARVFLDSMLLLAEDRSSTLTMIDLVEAGLASGRQVHDANVVAVALAHGAAAIVTDNTRHFLRFADRIGIQNLTPH